MPKWGMDKSCAKQQFPLVHIAFNLPTERFFTYFLPPELETTARLGQRVLAPFGKRRLIGYLVALDVPAPEPGFEIKPIQAILDPEPLLDAHLLKLSQWISEYYCCPLGMVLDSCLPPGLKGKHALEPKQQIFYQVAISREEALSMAEKLAPRAPRQSEVLNFLAQETDPVSGSELRRRFPSASPAVKALLNKGLLTSFSQEIKPQPYYGQELIPNLNHTLTPHQEEALELVKDKLIQEEFACLLLHGVTGSGKTEVYLQAIESALACGRQALVMVPEISLTPQLVERFRSRFTSQIAVLHSQLSSRERLREWQRLQQGEAAIGIGVRAAVLTPLPRLGLIVVDEEHENSYKQDNLPRYHARDVAIMRAKMAKIPVLLGSATPSLESYYNTQRGKADLICLPERIGRSKLPPVQVVDLRKLKTPDTPPLFSPPLLSAIEERLKRGEQSLLFLNRRGHYSFAFCKECGESVKCPHCSVSLTYHSQGNRLCCHYCSFALPPLGECPQCKGAVLTYAGLGTQRLESELKAIFPQARIMRMDRDSTRHKGAHWDFFEALKEQRIDILLGTQMVTKGLDLPNITLVGVIAADLILNFPDFRAAERTFQLLTQVAGRAGRGELEGEVIIQSFMPQHYSIQAACKHDYQAFYQSEMRYRRALSYPPYYRIANLLVRGRQSELCGKAAKQLASRLRRAKISRLAVLGASQAPLSKLRGEYRWQILLKAPSAAVLGLGLKQARQLWQNEPTATRLRLDIDMDAISLL